MGLAGVDNNLTTPLGECTAGLVPSSWALVVRADSKDVWIKRVLPGDSLRKQGAWWRLKFSHERSIYATPVLVCSASMITWSSSNGIDETSLSFQLTDGCQRVW